VHELSFFTFLQLVIGVIHKYFKDVKDLSYRTIITWWGYLKMKLEALSLELTWKHPLHYQD
jgi:hypothetical protein